jgi:hypothetical protein
MNAKLKAKWVKALRSGQYDQTEGKLCNSTGDAFCCLGVLLDIQGAVWRQPNEDEYGGLIPVTPKANRRIGDIDIDVQAWRGGLSDTQAGELSGMNDDGESFSKIANYIEANL